MAPDVHLSPPETPRAKYYVPRISTGVFRMVSDVHLAVSGAHLVAPDVQLARQP